MSQTDANAACNGNGKRKDTSPPGKQNVKKLKTKPKFQFGNYNQYYGYRNVNECIDPRVTAFHKREDLFKNKDILDIGCNIGHVTYIIARDFGPKSVLGMDIDDSLIKIARKNRRHYCTYLAHSDQPNPDGLLRFPDNISFIHSNFVLDHDNLIELVEPQYDVILCLSVTKWIHLNWGDDGLKRAFKRVFKQLRPGGVFILEAQLWDSYKKKKVAKLRSNCNIAFLPSMFKDYLLSSEIGFGKNETLKVPDHHSKGFKRPIELYFKD